MLTSEAVARLNVATQALVERCASNYRPYQCLEEGLAELAASPDWSEDEVAQVRRAATRIIDQRRG